MWDVNNTGLPKCLMQILNFNKKSSRKITHSKKYIPLCRTKYKISFITTSGTILWNNIPDNIKELKSKTQFTKSFKKTPNKQINYLNQEKYYTFLLHTKNKTHFFNYIQTNSYHVYSCIFLYGYIGVCTSLWMHEKCLCIYQNIWSLTRFNLQIYSKKYILLK